MKDYKALLEKELEARGLDAEVDMLKCGSLNMVCRITLNSLLAGNRPNTGFPNCIRVFSKKTGETFTNGNDITTIKI